MTVIIEHHTFRLVDGVTDEEFLELDRRVQTEFAVHQYGFVRRTTARGSGGEWLVESFWWSREDADAARTSDDDSAAALRAVIAPATESVRHYETLD